MPPPPLQGLRSSKAWSRRRKARLALLVAGGGLTLLIVGSDSGWWQTTRALAGKGPRHLMKMPAYASVRLKQNHPKMHAAYVRFFLEPVGRFVLRHLYR